MESCRKATRCNQLELWGLIIILFGGGTSVLAVEPDDTVKQIEKAFSGVQRRIVTEPSRAEKEFIEARKMLAQLKEASPSHTKLPGLQKRADDLAVKIEKRLGRPIGGSTTQEKAKPKSTSPETTPSTLPSSVISRLKQMDSALGAVTTALEKNQLQTAGTKLKTAQKLMDEIQKRYGKTIPANNAEMKAAQDRLSLAVANYTQAASVATAAAAALAAREQQKQAQSQEWIEKLAPFLDIKSGKYLLMGAAFNRATDAEKETCRKAYVEANKLMAAYKKTEFIQGKTPELISWEQRLNSYLMVYNEGETRAQQEAACRPWVDQLRAFVDVGAGSSKYLVDSVTLSETEIQQRTALLEEAKALWPAYEKAEFPHGKTAQLLALEEEMQQRFRDMPESLRQSRALISGDIEKEFDRLLGYLNRDTGWQTDVTKKPNIAMARDVTALQKALERYASTVDSDDPQLATLNAKLTQIRQLDQKNRALCAERTFMDADRFEGDATDELRQKVEEIVKVKTSNKPLRITLPAEKWTQEEALEWTDTSRTALRYRITRFMTAQAAAPAKDGKVYLHRVHLANDRQSDGSWGPLHGHIMSSDWIVEANVDKDPPGM